MRDELGLYYHAQAGNPRVRVYVRRGENGEIEFRLWEAENPQVWERHQWLPFGVIEAAARLYRSERNPGVRPDELYDLDIARSLLRENEA